MYLNQFFTDYDEEISQPLNIDPLGMTMIWSRLGQDIFNNRVSSISNDVRNYTLNLIHHYVIKELLESDDARLSRELEKTYEQIDSLAFKQTCLIFLENIFVFSMLEAEAQSHDVQTQGILGSSKARLKISDGTPKESLLFTKEPAGQLLVRQLTLGISGRYKTPFIEMSFFDREYRYLLPNNIPQWEKAQKFIRPHDGLRKLVEKSVQFLKALIKQPNPVPTTSWQDIPKEIKQQYVECFASSEVVGSYSKGFWLDVTELDQKASGSLYKAIGEIGDSHSSAQVYFEHALMLETDEREKQKLKHICQVEPFLAECELLFTLLMSKKVQSDKDIYDTYRSLNRDVSLIVTLARSLKNLDVPFSGSASKRYNTLLVFGELEGTDTQENMTVLVEMLLQYHRGIMEQRGQSPWVEKDRQGNCRCHMTLRQMPTLEKRPYKSWYHRYYFDQFSQLIRGLEGKEND